MSWRGAYATQEDGFAYGEDAGKAGAILAVRKLAETSAPEVRVALRKLEQMLTTPDVLEALAYLEQSRRSR